MELYFEEFGRCWQAEDGVGIARTLSVSEDMQKLRSFVNGANSHSVEREIKKQISWQLGRRGKDESPGWVAIYVAFWKAASEILGVQDGRSKVHRKVPTLTSFSQVLTCVAVVAELNIRGMEGRSSACIPGFYKFQL